jgi:virulence factor
MSLRIAIIGLGDIAQKAYLPLLTAWEGVEPLFCTRNEDVLAKLQAQYRVSLGTTRLEALLDWQPQAAFVLASTPAHAGLAVQLLSAGVDVYLEKPAASTGTEARSLAEQADSAGRILMVGFNRRYAPLHRQARQLWGERTAGIAVMQKHRSSGFHPNLRQHYTEELVHVVDMLRYFCGEGRAVRTDQQFSNGTFSGLTSTVALESGGMASIQSSMRAGHWKEQYALHGEGASLYLDAFSRVDLVEGSERRSWEETYASSWKTTLKGRGFQDEIAHFLECVQNRSQPETTGWDCAKTQQLVEELISLSEGDEV